MSITYIIIKAALIFIFIRIGIEPMSKLGSIHNFSFILISISECFFTFPMSQTLGPTSLIYIPTFWILISSISFGIKIFDTAYVILSSFKYKNALNGCIFLHGTLKYLSIWELDHYLSIQRLIGCASSYVYILCLFILMFYANSPQFMQLLLGLYLLLVYLFVIDSIFACFF